MKKTGKIIIVTSLLGALLISQSAFAGPNENDGKTWVAFGEFVREIRSGYGMAEILIDGNAHYINHGERATKAEYGTKAVVIVNAMDPKAQYCLSLIRESFSMGPSRKGTLFISGYNVALPPKPTSLNYFENTRAMKLLGCLTKQYD